MITFYILLTSLFCIVARSYGVVLGMKWKQWHGRVLNIPLECRYMYHWYPYNTNEFTFIYFVT
jgi:hypothetical protein